MHGFAYQQQSATDLLMVQLKPLPPLHHLFIKIQVVLEKRLLNRCLSMALITLLLNPSTSKCLATSLIAAFADMTLPVFCRILTALQHFDLFIVYYSCCLQTLEHYR